MTRITYSEINGLLRSKAILLGSDSVVVTVAPESLEAVVTSLNTAMPVAAIKSDKNLTDLKTKVKKRLIELGAIFKDEVRPGRTLNNQGVE